MARSFEVGERVRILGGLYQGKRGVVSKVTPVYVFVKHVGTGEIKRSQRRFCAPDESSPTTSQGRRPPPVGPRLAALIRATAAVVGEAGVDVEEAIVLFAMAAAKAAPQEED